MSSRRDHRSDDADRQALRLALLHLADALNLTTSLPWRDPNELLAAVVRDLAPLAALSNAVAEAVRVLDVQRDPAGADPDLVRRRFRLRRRTLRSPLRRLHQRGDSRE